jgi:hypothetical protein
MLPPYFLPVTFSSNFAATIYNKCLIDILVCRSYNCAETTLLLMIEMKLLHVASYCYLGTISTGSSNSALQEKQCQVLSVATA